MVVKEFPLKGLKLNFLILFSLPVSKEMQLISQMHNSFFYFNNFMDQIEMNNYKERFYLRK